MKDERGLYYYPNPQNKKVRTYVRQNGGAIEFRLWNQDDPALWDAHGWVPHGAIQAAMEMYSGNRFDPSQAYDIELAKAVIRDDG